MTEQTTPQNAETGISRRGLLGGVAVGGMAMAVAPGVTLISPKPVEAKPDDQAVTSAVRWGMLIDTNACDDGCTDCVTACQTENGWGNASETRSSLEQKPQWIRKVTVTNPDTEHTFSAPVMCQHCETPPCADVCPTGASFKRADGIVLVDRHICIGCRYCMMACPYKARSFVHEDVVGQKTHLPRGKGCVESCTLCVHRVDEGKDPACVETCSKKGNKALIFGDLNDPNSEISKRLKEHGGSRIRQDLGLNNGVYYQGI